MVIFKVSVEGFNKKQTEFYMVKIVNFYNNRVHHQKMWLTFLIVNSN